MTSEAIIFDLDGTLADVRHRLPLIKNKPKRWAKFFDSCVLDPPHDHVCLMFHCISQTLRGGELMIICSGRPDSHRQQTEEWLHRYHINYNLLLMRKAGDYRSDTVVKKEMLDKIRAEDMRVLFAVDDRPSVIKMWRDNEVPVVQVNGEEWAREARAEIIRCLLAAVGDPTVLADKIAEEYGY